MQTQQPFVIERSYNASAEKIWQAITDKNQMKQWYFDVDDFKPELGFEFRFDGKSDEKTYHHVCKIIEVIPNKKLKHSWQYENYEGISYVTWELFEEGNSTRLKLTHEGLESFPQNNPDFARQSFEKGWTHILGASLNKFLKE